MRAVLEASTHTYLHHAPAAKVKPLERAVVADKRLLVRRIRRESQQDLGRAWGPLTVSRMNAYFREPDLGPNYLTQKHTYCIAMSHTSPYCLIVRESFM